MLDPDRRILLQARLTKAEEAYDDIMIGGAVRVVVDQNGERVEYAAASSSRLAQYIQGLKIELGLMAAPGPVRPFW